MSTKTRLRLHRRDELEFVIMSCSKVLKHHAPASIVGEFDSHLKALFANDAIIKIWDVLSNEPLLWKDGFSILLPLNVRETFQYYRELSPKKRLKLLTKKVKEGAV